MAIQATGGNVGGTTWGNSKGSGSGGSFGGSKKPKPHKPVNSGVVSGWRETGIPTVTQTLRATPGAVAGQAQGSSGSSYRRSRSSGYGGSSGGGVGAAAAAAAQAAAAREKSIRDAYGQAQAQNATLYDTAYATIADKKHELADNYGKAINSVQLDLHNQTNATNAAARQRDEDQAQAAQRMGLDFVPTTKGRADATDAANLQAVNMHENAWRGLLNSQKLTALERNQAAADVFKNSKAQEAAIIRKQMLAQLGLA
jgi:hypothetical protein